MFKTKGHLKIFRVTGLFVVLVLASIFNLFAERPSYAEITTEKQEAFEACMEMDINIDPKMKRKRQTNKLMRLCSV